MNDDFHEHSGCSRIFTVLGIEAEESSEKIQRNLCEKWRQNIGNQSWKHIFMFILKSVIWKPPNEKKCVRLWNVIRYSSICACDLFTLFFHHREKMGTWTVFAREFFVEFSELYRCCFIHNYISKHWQAFCVLCSMWSIANNTPNTLGNLSSRKSCFVSWFQWWRKKIQTEYPAIKSRDLAYRDWSNSPQVKVCVSTEHVFILSMLRTTDVIT